MSFKQFCEDMDIKYNKLMFYQQFEFYEKLRKEGKLKILPCKIGEIAFVITECSNIYSRYSEMNGVFCPFNKENQECKSCSNNVSIFEDTVTQIMIDENNIHIFVKNCAVDGILGENIFLDKRIAKNALNDKWK